MMSRDYLGLKVWDLRMETKPVETYQVSNYIPILYFILTIQVARWPRGERAQRAIAEDKQRSRRSVIGWLIIYYLELLSASEGTLSHWSQLHL
jgi:hypothetical protein